MKNNEYWNSRAEQRVSKHFDNAEVLNKRLKREYEKALKEIDKEISYFYAKYSTNNGLSYQQALLELTRSEYKTFKMSIEEYVTQIEKYGDKALLKELNALSTRSRINRLESLKASIDTQLGKLYGEQQISINNFLSTSMKDNYYQSIFEVQKGLGYGSSFAKISPRRIETALKYPWSGEQFSERIWGNRQQLSKTIKQELTQSLIQGRSGRKTAQSIASKMDNSYKNAMRLVRTETGFIVNESTALGYESAGVEKYQVLATLDGRTSDICQEQDNEIYDLKDRTVGVNYPPFHVACRTTTVVYFEDANDERIARGADGKTYNVPGNMSYKEWSNRYV